MLQYYGRELSSRVLYFPVCARFSNQSVAWALTYNISDTHIRIRGLFVEPEHRGKGIGPALCDYAVSLWPSPWFRCVGYWRDDSFTRLAKSWGLQPVESVQPRVRITGDQRKIEGYKLILAYKDFAPRTPPVISDRLS